MGLDLIFLQVFAEIQIKIFTKKLTTLTGILLLRNSLSDWIEFSFFCETSLTSPKIRAAIIIILQTDDKLLKGNRSGVIFLGASSIKPDTIFDGTDPVL